jgi:hypothetical protein
VVFNDIFKVTGEWSERLPPSIVTVYFPSQEEMVQRVMFTIDPIDSKRRVNERELNSRQDNVRPRVKKTHSQEESGGTECVKTNAYIVLRAI